LHIGIDVLFNASGGSFTNLVTLLHEWAARGDLRRHRFTLFCSGNVDQRLRSSVDASILSQVRLLVYPRSSRGLLLRLVDEQFLLPLALRRERIDVLFCPGNVIPYASRIPAVATFQNPTPFCETVNVRSVGLRRWLQFQLIGFFMRATARRARRIIFICEYFRTLLLRRFGYDRHADPLILRSIREKDTQADPELEARLGIRRPFLLYVSHLNPYKNVVELIEAFALSRKTVPDRQLVLVGMSNFPAYGAKIAASIARHGFTPNEVLVTGELPHADGLKLMKSCEAFLFASTCEMCPTAIIEALSLGAPTACSNVNVMPEIAGDAVLYFDPHDPADIASAIDRVVNDERLRESLRERGRRRAAEFPTAAEVARRTLEAIESLAPGG
jgi:glycosyltransferase involved in cell wall biosynthesis